MNETPNEHPDNDARPAGDSAPVSVGPPNGPRTRLAALGARLVYWAPVLIPMVLFAQIAFLGLRPALREKERLAAAELELGARHARDLELARDVVQHLRARRDPVYLERQRRLRQAPPAPGS